MSLVAQSFPLSLRHTYTVQFGGMFRSEFMDFHPGQQLRIVGPVFRDGSDARLAAVGPVVSVKPGPEGGLNIGVRASPDLLGYEESWFAVRAGADGALRLDHQRTRFFQGTEAESLEEPQGTRFAFLSGARFIRMIYLLRVAEAHDHDLLFVKGSTRSELDARSASVIGEPGRCRAPDAEDWCAVGPRELSFNLFVSVEFNGSREQVAPGTPLGRFLRGEIGGSVTDAKRSLVVIRPHAARLAKVDFDRSSDAILSLPLIGGEKIQWRGDGVRN